MIAYQNNMWINPAFRFNFSNSTNEDIEALNKDFYSFSPFYFSFSSLAMNISKIIFPKEMQQLNSELLEKILFYRGRAALIRDPDKGYFITDFTTISGAFNWFNYPTKIQPIDIFSNRNLSFPILNDNDFIIIEANDFWYPAGVTVWGFAKNMARAYESAQNNVIQQKFPIIFQGTNGQKLTFQQLMAKIQKDYNYIFCDKELNLGDITKIQIDAKFISKELLDLVDRYKAQLLELLGVQNVGVVKQSGISDEEVNANNNLTNLFGSIALDKKRQAIDEIEEKFQISCDLWINPEIVKGGEDNGTIYDFN